MGVGRGGENCGEQGGGTVVVVVVKEVMWDKVG